MLLPIISLDLETTGLDPDRHGPWEIAWATCLHDTDRRELRMLSRARWFISLTGTEQLDPAALRIGGFMERYAQLTAQGKRLPWWAIQHQLLDDLSALRATAVGQLPDDALDHGTSQIPATHLIGAVPQFDHRMLERWLGWNHRHWHYHLIDVETLSAGWLGIAPPFDTNEMTTRMLGHGWVNPWGAKHEALADVRWNLELYAKAMNLNLIIPPDLDNVEHV